MRPLYLISYFFFLKKKKKESALRVLNKKLIRFLYKGRSLIFYRVCYIIETITNATVLFIFLPLVLLLASRTEHQPAFRVTHDKVCTLMQHYKKRNCRLIISLLLTQKLFLSLCENVVSWSQFQRTLAK